MNPSRKIRTKEAKSARYSFLGKSIPNVSHLLHMVNVAGRRRTDKNNRPRNGTLAMIGSACFSDCLRQR